MSDFSELKKNFAKMKEANAKKKKIEGYIADIRKLNRVASMIYKGDVGTSGEVLKLAYEGVERLAGLTKHSYIGQYLAYHKKGIDSLAGILKAADMVEFVETWQSKFEKRANELAKSANVIKMANNFASSMINANNKFPTNLPPEFKAYYNYVKDYEDHWDEMMVGIRKKKWDKATLDKYLQATPYLSKAYSQEIADKGDRLGLVVLVQANDVASAYVYFAKEHQKFVRLGEKANKMMGKLQKSKGSADFSLIKHSEYQAQLDLVKGIGNKKSSSDMDQHLLFYSGDWKKTSSYIKAGKAIKQLKEVSLNWQKWAILVEQKNHLHMY